jgi:hypothetical protein
MDRGRESNEEQQGEIRSSVIAPAIRYRLVVHFAGGGRRENCKSGRAIQYSFGCDRIAGGMETGTSFGRVGYRNNQR